MGTYHRFSRDSSLLSAGAVPFWLCQRADACPEGLVSMSGEEVDREAGGAQRMARVLTLLPVAAILGFPISESMRNG